MKVYVAGSSKELGRAKAAMQLLRDYGHEVTHDWVALVEQVGSANPADADELDRARWSLDDLKGVDSADALWLLMPEQEGAGAFVELGYALALDKIVIASGPGQHRTIFTTLAWNHETDMEAFEEEFAHEAEDE